MIQQIQDFAQLYPVKFVIVMVAMFLVDICWAKYFIYVGKHKPFLASAWGSSILLFGAVSTISYVHDRTFLIAAFLGSFIGTYWAVNKERKKAEKAEPVDGAAQ